MNLFKNFHKEATLDLTGKSSLGFHIGNGIIRKYVYIPIAAINKEGSLSV